MFAVDVALGKVCIALDRLRLRILRSESLNGALRLRGGGEDFLDVCSGSLSSSSRKCMDLRPMLDEAYIIFEVRRGSSFMSRRGCLSSRLNSSVGCCWLVTGGGVRDAAELVSVASSRFGSAEIFPTTSAGDCRFSSSESLAAFGGADSASLAEGGVRDPGELVSVTSSWGGGVETFSITSAGGSFFCWRDCRSSSAPMSLAAVANSVSVAATCLSLSSRSSVLIGASKSTELLFSCLTVNFCRGIPGTPSSSFAPVLGVVEGTDSVSLARGGI
mmetsp:Transcript_13778/g.31602  ORF Transcript_13778/g.31602 Transcript_13778/m.31602 type:complete len:274 (+) Transcript_13778:1632-2453(+)